MKKLRKLFDESRKSYADTRELDYKKRVYDSLKDEEKKDPEDEEEELTEEEKKKKKELEEKNKDSIKEKDKIIGPEYVEPMFRNCNCNVDFEEIFDDSTDVSTYKCLKCGILSYVP